MLHPKLSSMRQFFSTVEVPLRTRVKKDRRTTIAYWVVMMTILLYGGSAQKIPHAPRRCALPCALNFYELVLPPDARDRARARLRSLLVLEATRLPGFGTDCVLLRVSLKGKRRNYYARWSSGAAASPTEAQPRRSH